MRSARIGLIAAASLVALIVGASFLWESSSIPRPAAESRENSNAELAGVERRTREKSSHRVVARLVDRGSAWPAPEPPSLILQDHHTFRRQSSATSRIPSATLEDESRYVLATYGRALLRLNAAVDVDSDGTFRARFELGRKLHDVSEILASLLVRVGKQKWRELPARLVKVQSQGRDRWIDYRGVLDPSPSNESVRMTAFAYRPPGQTTTTVRSPPLSFPAHSRLHFGFGLMKAADDARPVRFQIEGCAGEECKVIFEESLYPGATDSGAWQDRSIPLSSSDPETRELRFSTSREAETPFALPVWSNPIVTAPEGGERMPSFVIVSIDTLRRDHLDAYGYERETAPFLNRLVEERGILFEDMVSEAATTDPSHMSLFTSLPAIVHGVQEEPKGLKVPVATLAEILRRDGYRTAAFTENGPLARGRGFGIGFEHYGENKSINRLRPTGHVQETLNQGRAWLDQNGHLPFLLFLHTFQVHAPYAPPEHLVDRFTDAPRHPDSLDDPKLRTRRAKLVNDYDREIRFVDEQLEALYTWANAVGINENTWWIFLSDHGEEFFEHGSLGHSTLPYREVLNVPLVVVGPKSGAGTRDATPLHHVDLMPTLLDLAGLPSPDGLAGTTFADRLGSKPSATPALARPRFSATWELLDGLEGPAHSVQRGAWKLIRYREGGTEHRLLFDLTNDRAETEDRSALDGRESEELGELLDTHLRESEADRKRRAQGLDPREGGEVPPTSFDPERTEKLRALGYLE